MKNKQKKKEKIPALKNDLYILSLIWKLSPARVVLLFVLRFLSFASWAFYTVVFMRYLFGSGSADREFSEAVTFVWIVAAVSVVQICVECWYYNRFAPLTDIKIHYALNRMMFDKASSVDASCWSDPEFFDDYTKATTEAFSRSISLLTAFAELLSAALSSVYVIVTMCQITWFTLVFISFQLVGQLVFSRRVRRISFERTQAEVPARRRYDYVNRTVYLKKYAEEMRLTGAFDVMSETYTSAYGDIKSIIKKFSIPRAVNDIIASFLCFPFAFQGMWLCGAIMVMVTKTMSLGDFVVLSSAIVSTTWMLDSFSGSINSLYENGLFAGNFKRFLSYKPRIDENGGGLSVSLPVKTIELVNVSFKYPHSDSYVLRDVNMTLESGTKYALVGINGSGKTTLVKLIMRLYDPTEGAVLMNGVDIREYDVREYRRLIGTTFQDFAIFSSTVLENVMLGSVDTQEKRKACLDAIAAAGVADRIDKLEHGADTMLTREFDDEGAVLSGGENQKIAIARAFAHATPVVILDEPSSALDPIAEYKMYETITRLCDKCDPAKGKISVIISHRMSSAAMSDHIFVLENGLLAESGTHAELCRTGGIYADMFARQAENYLDGCGKDEADA